MSIRTLIFFASIITVSAHAQIVLQKAVIANAGGRVASATTRLDYTTGETAVGVAKNSTTTGQFGFWSAPTITLSVKQGNKVADAIALRPNPASSVITIEVDLRSAATLDLRLYDATGQLVTTIHSGRKDAGPHMFSYDVQALATGTYFVAAMVPGALIQSKLTVVR